MSLPKTSTQALSHRAEILLVAGRELRTQLLKKSSVIANLLTLALVVGGIIAWGLYHSGPDEPYRVSVTGADPQVAAALSPALEQMTTSGGKPVEVVDSQPATKENLCEDGQDKRPDMVVDLGATQPTATVCESTDEAVLGGVTALLQQAALSEQVTALGGDPSQVATTLASATPQVVVLDPPSTDREDFGPRYALMMTIDVLLLMTLMGGGQMIAMGVVEEKSSRIVEILLACVRPTSLLAGKILGTGTAVLGSWAVIAFAGLSTAKVMGVLPDIDLDLDLAAVVMLVWMLVGFLSFAVLFAAAGSLVSRQEDISSTTMPLIMLCMLPYMASIFMALNNPDAVWWKVASFVPFFSPFLMPARAVFGVASPLEQAVGLVIALAALPLLVWVAARIYTRAVTRTGARVPLKEVLGRQAA